MLTTSNMLYIYLLKLKVLNNFHINTLDNFKFLYLKDRIVL